MRLFKTTFKNDKGQTKEAAKWYVEFRNHDSAVRRIPAFTDKQQSDEFGRKVEKLVEARQNSELPDAKLMQWALGLPAKMVTRLLELGLLPTEKVEAMKPLSAHLVDYRTHLEAQNRDEAYVGDTIAQVQRIIDGCGFVYWRDVTAEKVQTFAASLRKEGGNAKAITHRTYNGYVAAFKSFANWAVDTSRIPYSPVAKLKRIKITDAKLRRAFDLEEFRWLLVTAEKGAMRFQMPGPERALVYRLAVETGLRASEIASLTRSSFHFGARPYVVIVAGSAKNQKRDEIQLKAETAAKLEKHLQTKMPASKAFAMPSSAHTAKLIRFDIADARAAWLEAGGDPESAFLQQYSDEERKLDFHSLRHTCGVWLFQYHGATPKEVQTWMRLSSIALVDRYTRSFRLTDDKLIERGPDLSPPVEAQRQVATGTYGATSPQTGNLAESLALRAGRNGTEQDITDVETSKEQPKTPVAPKGKGYKETLNLPQTQFPMEAKLVANEPDRLKMWQEGRLYEKLIAARASSPKGKWVLHDGPPFANGDIHIGHVINKVLKDVILRFRSMQGYQTPYVPGWDCHGLPIEHKIQQELGPKLREMATVDVRKKCHDYAAKYVKVQGEQFQRLGILGEWENPYLTMKPEYESDVLEVFGKFVEAGLVYKKLKPVSWSVANRTALAEAELEYQDVEDTSVYVEFPLTAPLNGQQASLLIWTTTPWTLPANLAVAANADVEYAVVRFTRDGRTHVVVLAAELVERVFANSGVSQFERVGVMKGAELEGAEYRHPFVDRSGKVVTADYVTTTDGSGLVHTAPGHGEEDYETGIKHGLDVYSPVQADGRFDETVPEWLRGKTVWEGNPLVVAKLRDLGVLFAEEKITHSYPHDWRSKTPIIFRATEQWFIAMDKPFNGGPSLRERAKQAVGQTDFVPEWGKHRIGGMLDSRPDWCISRQRAWGLPIPVFYNDKGEPLLTPQSVRAVAKHVREKGSDAWFTDEPALLLGADFQYPPGFTKTNLRKEKDIFDVWFESGSSWHAVLQSRTYLAFPADLYLEGSDQHRGWFQLSLLPALGAAGVAPFKQVLTHGFVVKPDGRKVSKSDPEYVTATKEINTHGADLLRLWTCSVDYEGDIPTSPKVIKEFGDKYRKIRNTLRYLLSNLYDFKPSTDAQPIPPNSLDGWAMWQTDQLIREVTAAYDAYAMHRAFRALHDFCAVQISAVYGNAMKDRLYCEAPDSPLRRRAQTVMHRMAVVLTKLLAPMLVFTADEAWQYIEHKPQEDCDLDSVHLALLPTASGEEPSEEQKAEWQRLMELREQALLQLDQLKKEAGVNKALDAEVVYVVEDDELRRRLESYGVDLADMVGAGHHTFAEKGDVSGPAVTVKVIDRRDTYQACARSWKRRPDVGQDPDYPDLTLRDAQAVKARQ